MPESRSQPHHDHQSEISVVGLSITAFFRAFIHGKGLPDCFIMQQGEREIDLMRRLSTLQGNVDSGLPSDERRKTRKKIALLKSKIIDATAQKKAILLRLGDIYVELQSRETWIQIQNELHERRYGWWSIDSPSASAYATTPSDVTSMMPPPLDAASPVFFPAGCHPIYNTWHGAAPRFREHGYEVCYEVYNTAPAES